MKKYIETIPILIGILVGSAATIIIDCIPQKSLFTSSTTGYISLGIIAYITIRFTLGIVMYGLQKDNSWFKFITYQIPFFPEFEYKISDTADAVMGTILYILLLILVSIIIFIASAFWFITFGIFLLIGGIYSIKQLLDHNKKDWIT